ncbi:ankyrin repeat domain-containing protein [Cereibacter johrii]|uniref:ankyrin repeat domain-containing protein n=1 Tax=Cereibacter johrii TaxID=445629 RepID=UPI002B25862B|nr:ankyrin repeat domain-containing protein [Cereibacter johrii]MEA5162045.1 ankyrin repeat domain-containing protein [Cereibacter johrii]
MKFEPIPVVLCLLATAFAQPAGAQQDACRDILIPTTTSREATREQEFALAMLVKSDSDYMRHVNAGVSGSYKLFSAGGSYAEFLQKRESLQKSLGITMSESEAMRITTSYLPENQSSDWARCMASRNGGVLLFAEDITDGGVTVVARWEPLVNVPFADTTLITLSGAEEDAQAVKNMLPQRWQSRGSQAFELRRRPGEDLRLVVNIGSTSDKIFVPRVQPPVPDRGSVWEAASIGSISKLTALFDRGFGINEDVDDEGNRALHIAAERCHTDTVRWLIENGADRSMINKHKNSALQIATARCPTPDTANPDNPTAKAIRDTPAPG